MRARIWVPCLALLVLVPGALLLLSGGEEAEAGFTSEKTKELVEYLNGDAALNLKLQALDALRKKNESGIEGELEKLAKGKDTVLASYATTALGNKNTSAAKAKLKSLLENAKLDTKVRMGALSAIAYHWKDSGDLSWLESKTKKDAKLYSQYLALKKKVYGK